LKQFYIIFGTALIFAGGQFLAEYTIVGFLAIFTGALLFWNFMPGVMRYLGLVVVVMGLAVLWLKYPILVYFIVGICAVSIKLVYYPAKCPNCNNKASWITTDNDWRKEQTRQTIIREDVKLDRKGEYDGKTIRLEQVDVKIFEWEVITKCEHCNYVKSTEKKKETVPL
jgi:hypothetical protein